MTAAVATVARGLRLRGGWLAGLVPLAVLAAAVTVFVAFDAPGLERHGAPIETVVVQGTKLAPGKIELRIQNDGPDPVAVRQVVVNDGFASFVQSDPDLSRLERGTVTIPYPWSEGQRYDIVLLTSTGTTAETTIDAAAETPSASSTGFYGLMALIGFYVGVIPVAIGMLWLPWLRRLDQRWVRGLMAFTVGLLAFLAIDASLEGVEIATGGAQSLGGSALVYLGALVAYLALSGIDSHVEQRERRAGAASLAGYRLALLVAIGIGLHNLGEGLAIGSSYAVGSLALSSSLIVGFALHNTTEGLAVVAPVSSVLPPLRRLALLGAIAGAPTILGTWIGVSAFDTSLAGFLLGLGVGAIAQVAVKLAPVIRDESGRLLHPLAAGGLLAGLGVMYLTGLLVAA